MFRILGVLYFFIISPTLSLGAETQLNFEHIDKNERVVSIDLSAGDGVGREVYDRLDSHQKQRFLQVRSNILKKFFKGLMGVNFAALVHRMKGWALKSRFLTRELLSKKTVSAEENHSTRRVWMDHLNAKEEYEHSFKMNSSKLLMEQLDRSLFENSEKMVASHLKGFNIAVGINFAMGIGNGTLARGITSALGKVVKSIEGREEKIHNFKIGADFELGLKLLRNAKDRKIEFIPYVDYGKRVGEIIIPAHEIVISAKALWQNIISEAEFGKGDEITKIIFPMGLVVTSTQHSVAFGLMPGIGLPPVITTLATYELKAKRINFFSLNLSYGRVVDAGGACWRGMRKFWR